MKKYFFSGSIIILVAMTLLFTVGCQKQATITSADPQIQKVIKMAGASADKSMEKELIYLRDTKGVNLSNVRYINKNSERSYYEYFDDGGWDIAVGSIIRKQLQEEMHEYYSINYLTGIKDKDSSKNITEDRLQVIKELQFMRDEGMITPEYYEKLIKRNDIPLMWGIKLWEQMYPTCDEPECDGVYSRVGIQNMMKEKEKNLTP